MTSRVGGIDSIRFMLAACVTIGHIGLPIEVDPSTKAFPVNALQAFYSNVFNGPAAVVCFFLISGFCIHFPYRSRTVELASYYARRHVRIWIPILAALVIAKLVGYQTSLLGDSILWSLIAEEIYYIMYPFLRNIVMKEKSHWFLLLLISTFAAICVISTNPTVKNYPSFGIYGNWLLGLPVWLSGCLLAEHYESIRFPGRSVYAWRLGLIVVFVVTSIARFHLSIGYPITLSVASVYFWFWLRAEAAFYKVKKPALILESLGKFTYSLYLTHLIFFHVLSARFGSVQSSDFWRCVYLVSIACFAVLFYFVVEAPSHRLGKWLGKCLSREGDQAVPVRNA